MSVRVSFRLFFTLLTRQNVPTPSATFRFSATIFTITSSAPRHTCTLACALVCALFCWCSIVPRWSRLSRLKRRQLKGEKKRWIISVLLLTFVFTEKRSRDVDLEWKMRLNNNNNIKMKKRRGMFEKMILQYVSPTF